MRSARHAARAPGRSPTGHPPDLRDRSRSTGWVLEGGTVLRVRGLHMKYRHREVLRGVDLDLPLRRVVGVVGENGADKSTLLRILTGDLAPDSGLVWQDGRLGHCPQEAELHDAFTVEQHLRFCQVAYGLPSLDRAFELMESLRFTGHRHARLSTLSGGTRQKLNLVLFPMHDPEVLLLDEPYQGFDWETYLRFWELAEDLRDRGCSVLVVSHLAYDASRLDVLHRLADGVLREVDRVIAAHLRVDEGIARTAGDGRSGRSVSHRRVGVVADVGQATTTREHPQQFHGIRPCVEEKPVSPRVSAEVKEAWTWFTPVRRPAGARSDGTGPRTARCHRHRGLGDGGDGYRPART